MVTLMSHQSVRREQQVDGSATSWFPAGAALGLAGLATASTAITCLVISRSSSSAPPPQTTYLLALSGLFYAGMAEIGAAVWVMAEPGGRHVATGRKLVYASLVPLTAALGLLAAATTLFW